VRPWGLGSGGSSEWNDAPSEECEALMMDRALGGGCEYGAGSWWSKEGGERCWAMWGGGV
jgi:hypothetical protein